MPTRSQFIAKAASLPVGSSERKNILAQVRRKKAYAVAGRAIVMACASSSTCRKATAKALRFPGSMLDIWYDGVEDVRADLMEGMLTPKQEQTFGKLTKVMTSLSRVQLAPLDMLANALEAMNNDDAELLSKLAK